MNTRGCGTSLPHTINFRILTTFRILITFTILTSSFSIVLNSRQIEF